MRKSGILVPVVISSMCIFFFTPIQKKKKNQLKFRISNSAGQFSFNLRNLFVKYLNQMVISFSRKNTISVFFLLLRVCSFCWRKLFVLLFWDLEPFSILNTDCSLKFVRILRIGLVNLNHNWAIFNVKHYYQESNCDVIHRQNL